MWDLMEHVLWQTGAALFFFFFWHSCGDSVDQPHDCMFSLDIFGISIFFNLYENKKDTPDFLSVTQRLYLCICIIPVYVTLYVCIINFLLLPRLPIG